MTELMGNIKGLYDAKGRGFYQDLPPSTLACQELTDLIVSFNERKPFRVRTSAIPRREPAVQPSP
jgi:hypothetical protein